MMATIDELRQNPHWSYSALNTYLNVCQLQYFYRYVEQPEIERTPVCFPFGKAFHAALTAQAWECLMGSSLTREEIVNLFAESFKIETEIAPNLIYKEGENFDSMIALAARVQDAVDKGVFLPNETSFACAECPYRERCKSWHSTLVYSPSTKRLNQDGRSSECRVKPASDSYSAR